jgi:hypothetical protein
VGWDHKQNGRSERDFFVIRSVHTFKANAYAFFFFLFIKAKIIYKKESNGRHLDYYTAVVYYIDILYQITDYYIKYNIYLLRDYFWTCQSKVYSTKILTEIYYHRLSYYVFSINSLHVHPPRQYLISWTRHATTHTSHIIYIHIKF